MSQQPQPDPKTPRDQVADGAWPDQSEPIFDEVVSQTGIEPEKLFEHS